MKQSVSLGPEETILWHLGNGYNAMIVTDHNEIEPALKVREVARNKYASKMVVIVGQEWVSRK